MVDVIENRSQQSIQDFLVRGLSACGPHVTAVTTLPNPWRAWAVQSRSWVAVTKTLLDAWIN